MDDKIIDFKEGRFKHLVRIETARARAECRKFRETADLLQDGPDRDALLSMANRDPVEIARLTVRGQLLLESAEREPESPEVAALTQRLAEEQALAVAARRTLAQPRVVPTPQAAEAAPWFSELSAGAVSALSIVGAMQLSGSVFVGMVAGLMIYATVTLLRVAFFRPRPHQPLVWSSHEDNYQ